MGRLEPDRICVICQNCVPAGCSLSPEALVARWKQDWLALGYHKAATAKKQSITGAQGEMLLTANILNGHGSVSLLCQHCVYRTFDLSGSTLTKIRAALRNRHNVSIREALQTKHKGGQNKLELAKAEVVTELQTWMYDHVRVRELLAFACKLAPPH